MKTMRIGSGRWGRGVGIMALMAMMIASDVLAQDSSTRPLAWWKLDEGIGPMLGDSAKGLYPLALDGNSPTATVGVVDVPAGMPASGKSVKFNGDMSSMTGEYATRPSTAALCGKTFCVSAWVKPYDNAMVNQEGIVAVRTTLVQGWFLRWINNGGSNPEFTLVWGNADSSWGTVSSSTHAPGAWYHVVVQVEDNGASDKYRLYVNGTLEGENLAGGDYSPDLAAGFAIGARPDFTKWNGGVDDVQYYDYVLTTNDIHYLYDNPGRMIGTPVQRDSYVAPVAWWKLNEAIGPTLADAMRGLYPLELDGNSPTATVGVTDVPAIMPAGSRSVRFNGDGGSGEYATRASTAALCGKTFSVVGWVKPAHYPLNQEGILALRTTGPQGWFLRWYPIDGRAEFTGVSGSGSGWDAVSSSTHATGQWYHVVYQIEDHGASDTYRLYVNGTLEGEILAGGDYSPDAAAGFAIGARPDYTRWNGGVDDVQYYNYILTTNDIQYLMANPGKVILPIEGTVISIK